MTISQPMTVLSSLLCVLSCSLQNEIIYIYIYIYVCVCVCVHAYVRTHAQTHKGNEIELKREGEGGNS